MINKHLCVRVVSDLWVNGINTMQFYLVTVTGQFENIIKYVQGKDEELTCEIERIETENIQYSAYHKADNQCAIKL